MKPNQKWNDAAPQKPSTSRVPIESKVRLKQRRGIFEKSTKPAYGEKVYKVQGYRGNRHILVDGKGNEIKDAPVASDVRQVHPDAALSVPKLRTFSASSINKPVTNGLRRSKRNQARVDYSKFL